ncbi:maltose ABC transporter permease MalF [Burkholderiaceae bacterium DAT-1]|nr:maltose ABC transporter permease MalF [Burkholderiaceae bacterium DAT-1]
MLNAILTLSTDWRRYFTWLLTLVLALLALYVVAMVYLSGQTLWAAGLLMLVSAAFYVYVFAESPVWRYLFPGVTGMGLFVAFPLLYTAGIGFTNYSTNNLLSEPRARSYLLDQTEPDESRQWTYSLHRDGKQFRLALHPDSADPMSGVAGETLLVSEPLSLSALFQKPDVMMHAPAADEASAPVLSLKDTLVHRSALMKLKLHLPDQTVIQYAGVREFGVVQPVWLAETQGAVRNRVTGERFAPNRDTGYFENPKSERLQPGFTVGVGFAHYTRMLTDANFKGPFLQIFVWTVTFAGLTVLFTLALGCTLAVMLNWEALRFRTFYRTILFLPYAVPAFISILVFKGLFNQNFGEINAVLDALFGVKPAWFADPVLAKVMLLIVNTWLGYPYIMVLCTGLLKAIPADLYEASALAGASPLTNFFRITLPLIIRPLSPLLISAFAFNFNNFVVIALLTQGRPDFLNTKLPAGMTDLLVSYTYRIAFEDTGQQFGLAAAVSTVIFVLVALLSLANLKIGKVNQQAAR